jgi:glucose/arabinose dehydrogenase
VLPLSIPHERSWRYIKFDSNGKLLLTIGTPCNACDVDDPAVGTGGTGKFRYGKWQREQQSAARVGRHGWMLLSVTTDAHSACLQHLAAK